MTLSQQTARLLQQLSHLPLSALHRAMCALQGRKVLTLSEERAMQLYGLKHLRLVREPKLDTKCLMAWNEDTLVLAFRGTASKINAISDMKVGSSCEGCWPWGP